MAPGETAPSTKGKTDGLDILGRTLRRRRASVGLGAAELTHLLRPQGDRQAVDILLHTQPWDPDLGEPATAAAYEG